MLLSIQHLKEDARHFQILALSIFLLTGIFVLGWDSNFVKYSILFSSVMLFQFLFAWRNNISFDSLKSAIITGFSLSLLFNANHWSLYIVAAFLAIAGKFILRINGKHFINPANFGICATILIFGNSWISPGQWGSAIYLFLLISVLGFTVLYRAQRLDAGIAFLLFFLGMDFTWNLIYKDWPIDFFVQQSYNGALLLFSFFMITDPCSTPNHRVGRILFSLLVAMLAFYLANFHFVNGAALWALFILCPLTPLIDTFLVDKKFTWKAVKS